MRPCLILQSDVGWPYHLAEGREGGEACQGSVGAFFRGWSGRERPEAVPSGSSAWGVRSVVPLPEPLPPASASGGALSCPRGPRMWWTQMCRLLRGAALGSGSASVCRAGTQAGCLPSSHSGHGGGSGWRDIAGSETADLSQRPFH